MSVISIPRLPDQVNVNFGPADAIANLILSSDRAARESGVRLSCSSDFTELFRVNGANRVDWYPLTPNFDPRESDVHADNTFWLRGIDRHGDVVLCHVVRLYVFNRTTLKQEIESLRFMYHDPAPLLAAGVSGEATAPSAATMDGRLTFSGGLWVRSDFRGCGLARLIPPLSRALALTRWYPAFHTCFVSKTMAKKGMGEVYGYARMEDGVRISNLPGFGPPMFPPTLDFALCSMSTEAAVAEVERRALGVHHGVGIGLERQPRQEIHVGA